MASITEETLLELMKHCYRLRMLSLENVIVNRSICTEIGKNKNLEVLNMAMASGIDSVGIQNMIKPLEKYGFFEINKIV